MIPKLEDRKGLKQPLTVKLLPIPAPQTSWKMLGKLLVVVNYSLHTSGRSMVNLSQLLGTIIAHYTAAISPELAKEFEDVRAQQAKKQLERFFGVEQLDAIASAAAEDIPNAVRLGAKNKTNQRRSQARGALRRSG